MSVDLWTMGSVASFQFSIDLIQEYVANIGKLAEDGWETNQNFPIFGDIPSLGAQGDRSC